jgi:carboxypeptidase Q
MRFRKIAALLLAVVSILVVSRATMRAQQPATDPQVENDHKIMAEIKDHNEIMANLEYLSDILGPRLTGSETLTKASHWTQEKFSAYGLASAHLEPWSIAHAWIRGTASGRIISPAEHPLVLASAAWAPGTGGVVHGPVVYLKADKPEDLDQYKGKLKGAIVLTQEPFGLLPPDNPALVPYGDSIVPLATHTGPPAPTYSPAFIRMMIATFTLVKSEGALAILSQSDKIHGLISMNLGGMPYGTGFVPVEYVSYESYHLIWRLMKRGPVDVELNVTNTFSDKPVEVYNTVAEIKGSEKPDEVVILGAHLDSWDLGTGATDNGTGSMVVLEAARALQKLDLKPKRTIRFVLFTGEEQGLNGSRAYVSAHKDELSKISGALIHDTGTGRVLSIGLMGNYQDREVMDKVVAPLHDLGLLELSLRSMGGSDHASFDAAGVPGFWVIQEPMDYDQTHHSQADTFDEAHEDKLIQGAQVLAVWAYNVAQLPDLLPRKPATPGAAASAAPKQ